MNYSKESFSFRSIVVAFQAEKKSDFFKFVDSERAIPPFWEFKTFLRKKYRFKEFMLMSLIQHNVYAMRGSQIGGKRFAMTVVCIQEIPSNSGCKQELKFFQKTYSF